MADKSFGVKELNLLNASGTPTVTSPNNLNLNANTVAISTSCTIGNNLTVTSTTNSANLNVTGVGTLTRAFATDLSVSGISTISQPSNANPHSLWDVVNNSSSSYRFTGPGVVSTDDNPNIYLVRGQRYVFKVNASGHDFYIKTEAGTGTGNQYTDGVTGNGAATGNVVFNVQHDAPPQLKYQCVSHGAMVGNIYIVGNSEVISGVTTFSGGINVSSGTLDVATSLRKSSGTLDYLAATHTFANVAGSTEYFRFASSGQLGIAGANYGSSGQVLTSAGSGSAVTWSAIPAQATIANNADNRVITGGSGVNLNGESGLTYNGTRLDVTTGDLQVIGGEGGNAELRIVADQGDDGADYWRFQSAASGNNLNIATYASGAWVDKVSVNSTGQLSIGAEPASGQGLLNIKPGSGDDTFIKFRRAADFDGTFDGTAIDNRNGANNANRDLIVRFGKCAIWAGGTEKLRIASAGQLGIGGANYGTAGQVVTSTGNSTGLSWGSIYNERYTVSNITGTSQINVTNLGTDPHEICINFHLLKGVGDPCAILLRLGTSSGLYSSNGYNQTWTYFNNNTSNSATNSRNHDQDAFWLYNNNFSSPLNIYSGNVTLRRTITGTYVLAGSAMSDRNENNNQYSTISNGRVDISGACTQLRIYVDNGTNFAQGSVTVRTIA